MDKCKKQISIKCAREVGGSVIDNCCYELVLVGKTCHDIFFNYALASKPNIDKSRGLAKSTQAYDQCVEITVSPASSITIPTSKASNSKTLDECKKDISMSALGKLTGAFSKDGV
ncbi:hypothetical protein ACE6H2_006911 [Prunus campanulata]